MFRLPQAHALINRLGFNNEGVAALRRQRRARALSRRSRHQHRQELRHAERARRRRLRRVPARRVRARRTTSRSTSPRRTRKGLRDLQAEDALDALLGCAQARAGSACASARALRAARRQDRARPDRRRGARHRAAARQAQDGRRHRHQHDDRARCGGRDCRTRGESGRTVGRAAVRAVDRRGARARATRSTARCRSSAWAASTRGERAREKLDAGASLVQLYTGLIYRGPALVAECVRAVTPSAARTP